MPRAAARAPRVDFVGIGVQKAGTTWLHRMLAAHPDVFMAHAHDKDLRFFNAHYDRGYLWYERHFDGAGAKRRGEFSTSYFYSKDAPERVYRYNPEMRLLLSLRDPVERLISHHRHEIRLGRIAEDLPLEHAIASNPSYLEQSMYFTQLSRWLEWFPRASLHVVIFEEMFRDPAQAVRDLYAFVGVSPSFVPRGLDEKINAGRIPRSRLVERGASAAASALRAVGGGAIVDALKKARADARLRSANTRRTAPAPDPALVSSLRAELAAENAKLAALLGRDLSIWNGA
ncbi:MAG TPA: sulfotransferase [Gammaproteobacteria bacterium]